jgi:hypothetical protein
MYGRSDSVCAERGQRDPIKPTAVAFDAPLDVCADQPVGAELDQELEQGTWAQPVESLDLAPEMQIADVSGLCIGALDPVRSQLDYRRVLRWRARRSMCCAVAVD